MGLVCPQDQAIIPTSDVSCSSTRFVGRNADGERKGRGEEEAAKYLRKLWLSLVKRKKRALISFLQCSYARKAEL